MTTEPEMISSITEGNEQPVFEAAMSGVGTPLMDLSALEGLLQRARRRMLGVAAIEVYLLEGGQEIPALEFGLYHDEISLLTEGLSESRRVEVTLQRAQQLLTDLAGVKGLFGVQVWLE
jgi:hypothetical protein